MRKKRRKGEHVERDWEVSCWFVWRTPTGCWCRVWRGGGQHCVRMSERVLAGKDVTIIVKGGVRIRIPGYLVHAPYTRT